jgi:hypothetical protein
MKVKNLSGMRVGRLMAIELSGRTPTGQAIWKCICDCGKITEVRGYRLFQRNTQSCGCLRRESSQRKIYQIHQDAINPLGARNLVWSRYTGKARKAGIEFSLTVKEFDILIAGDCYWCGAPPCNLSVSKGGVRLAYSGIDRLKATHGYTSDNCVSCCKRCNFMKGQLSREEFIVHIRKILDIHGTKVLVLESEEKP